MSRATTTAVAVIGAGRLGTALVRSLAAAGHGPIAVTSRSFGAARRAAAGLPNVRAVKSATEAISSSRLILLAVPDREIGPAARALAREPELDWRGRVVLHHAGALGPDPLAPLARKGAATGVLHPLLALGPEPRSARARAATGAAARIEGTPAAVRAARRLARDLGWSPLGLGRRVGPRERAAYHAAASLASNDVVALLALATDVLASIGVEQREATGALAALARSALERVADAGLERGATGPVVRGDAATLRAHREALERSSKAALAAHRLLSSRLLELANLDPPLRRAVERALSGGRSSGRTV